MPKLFIKDFILKNKDGYGKSCLASFLMFIYFIALFGSGLALLASTYDVYAAINKQINYQGKLTDSVGDTVADGSYNIEFKLYTVSSGGSPIWTETRTGGDQVQVTNGLFSVLLGEVTGLDGVDFNQTLYLGVNIGGTGSPSWDGEMTPRKKIGAVPAAFVAETLNGLYAHQFFRNDAYNSTSSSQTFLTVEQNGSGAIAEFIGNASTTVLGLYTANGGSVGIGSTTPGSTLSVAGDISLTGALRASGNPGTSGMLLQTTGTGIQWVATSSLGISGGSSNYLTLGNGFLQTSTSTDYIKAAYFYASSTTATSTFAGAVAIGTTTQAQSTELTVDGNFLLAGGLMVGGTYGTNGMVLLSTGTGLQWTATSSLGISGGGGVGGTHYDLIAYSITAPSLGTLSDAQTIYFGNQSGQTPSTTSGLSKIYVSKSGTITRAEIFAYTVVAGSNEDWPMYIRVNDTTDYLIQTLADSSTTRRWATTTLAIPVSEGDYFEIKSDHPTWATNPTNFRASGSVIMEFATTTPGGSGAVEAGTEGQVAFYSSAGTIVSATSTLFLTGEKVGIGTTAPSEKLHVAGNILIGARTDSSPTWTLRSDSTAGTIASGGTSSIGTTSAMAVFNGSLYAGTSKVNGAEVYRYNGSGSWTQVSSTTAGYIGTSSVGNINTISTMAVYNGQLYVGTAEPSAAEVYRYDGNGNWTRISSSTAGAIGGNGTTTAIDSISAMAVHGGKLYIGTSKSNGAEVYRYNGPGLSPAQTWTKVSNLPSNAGTIGATASVDAVTMLVSFQGFLFAGTSEAGSSGALYRYDGQGISGTGFTLIGTAGTFSGTSAAGASTITAYGSIRTAAVYNGRLYLGVDDGAGTARIMKWDGSLTSGSNYELISSTTAGIIAEDVGATTGIDRIGAIAVYNDDLWVGTVDSTGIAEIYKLDIGATWTKHSNTTAGTISTSGGSTSAITGVMSMQVYNDDLWVGTEKASSAEIYSFNIAEGQSYNLEFEASSDNADGIQNSLTNKASIQFQAEETGYSNIGNMNTGKFVFSHGINTVTGAYDLAEDYPTHDDTLAPGDLVSFDTSEKGFVRKAQGRNDKDIIGIYSVDPALRLSQKDALIDGARAIPVALAGRVPVSVTLENGPIRIGDYLTSSLEPGKAARANKPGRVIGRALGSYAGLDGEVPTVTVFIGLESIGWNDLQDAEENVAELSDINNTQGQNAVIEFVDKVNNATEEIAFALLNKIDNVSIIITNKLTALFASIQELFVKTFTILPGGSITLPSGVNQITGIGIFDQGVTDVFIENEQVDEDTIIYVTPTSPVESPLYIGEKVPGKGFHVRMNKSSNNEVTFDWFFIKTYRPKGVGDAEVTTVVSGDNNSLGTTTITIIAPDANHITSNGDAVMEETVSSGDIDVQDETTEDGDITTITSEGVTGGSTATTSIDTGVESDTNSQDEANQESEEEVAEDQNSSADSSTDSEVVPTTPNQDQNPAPVPVETQAPTSEDI